MKYSMIFLDYWSDWLRSLIFYINIFYIFLRRFILSSYIEIIILSWISFVEYCLIPFCKFWILSVNFKIYNYNFVCLSIYYSTYWCIMVVISEEFDCIARLESSDEEFWTLLIRVITYCFNLFISFFID